MKRMLTAIGLTLASVALVGCGGSGDNGEPGTTDKGLKSNTERVFVQPDEYYDYGDYDRVKVIHLPDGTECVLLHVGAAYRSDSGGGIDCSFPSDTPTP